MFFTNVKEIKQNKTIIKSFDLEKLIVDANKNAYLIDQFPEKLDDYKELEEREIFYNREVDDHKEFFEYTRKVKRILSKILSPNLIIAVYWEDFDIREVSEDEFLLNNVRDLPQKEPFDVYCINHCQEDLLDELVTLSLASYFPIYILDKKSNTFMFIYDNEVVFINENVERIPILRAVVKANDLYLRNI